MTLTFIPLVFGNFRGWEWIIIGLVILLLFGGKKIPELMRGLGKGVQSFRKGVQEAREEMNRPLDGDDAPASKPKSNRDGKHSSVAKHLPNVCKSPALIQSPGNKTKSKMSLATAASSQERG